MAIVPYNTECSAAAAKQHCDSSREPRRHQYVYHAHLFVAL